MSEARFAAAALDPGGITRLELADGRAIAVYAVDGDLYATDDLCSHGEASLSEGELDGHEILCPFHMGGFDVRTGAATRAPCWIDIRGYAIHRDGDEIVVTDADADADTDG